MLKKNRELEELLLVPLILFSTHSVEEQLADCYPIQHYLVSRLQYDSYSYSKQLLD